MKNLRAIFWLVGLVLFSAQLGADSVAPAVTVNGAVSKPGDWTVDRIKSELADDVTSIQYSSRDGKHSSKAVPLVSLLKAAGVVTQLKQDAKADPRGKHGELHYVVTVEGSDGYYAVMSIAELLAEVGDRKVWLAIDMDGKPLSDKDGPAKLIVPDDQKPARWVHSVKTVSVVKVAPPTTLPMGEGMQK
jgi:DMSO/TMAO reductase YedYZ molybdopterin-dependent catalytic subunit